MLKRAALATVTLTSLTLLACSNSPPTSSPGIKPAKPGQVILIVHGAWGGGWAFREVDSLLTADGYKVYRPTLTGQGEKVHLASTDINLSLHINDIVNIIQFEDLHDIILVGHSYGGMVITGVADRLPDRITKRIYVDALLPENGDSVNKLMPDPIGRLEPDGYIHPTWPVPPNLPHDVLMPAKTFSEPITLKNPDALAKIPAVYILTVDPGKQPADDRFYPNYQRAQSYHWPTQTLTADHNPQWSHPRELVLMLEQNAQ